MGDMAAPEQEWLNPAHGFEYTSGSTYFGKVAMQTTEFALHNASNTTPFKLAAAADGKPVNKDSSSLQAGNMQQLFGIALKDKAQKDMFKKVQDIWRNRAPEPNAPQQAAQPISRGGNPSSACPAGRIGSLGYWAKNAPVQAADSKAVKRPVSPGSVLAADVGPPLVLEDLIAGFEDCNTMIDLACQSPRCRADDSAWQAWQQTVKDGAPKDGKEGSQLLELRAFMSEQFAKLQADQQQQRTIMEQLSTQLKSETQKNDTLQVQLRQAGEWYQAQVALLGGAHQATVTDADGKIGSLASQIRQLAAEKSACQGQLEAAHNTSAQFAEQVELLKQQLQAAKAETAAANSRADALQKQLSEAQQKLAGLAKAPKAAAEVERKVRSLEGRVEQLTLEKSKCQEQLKAAQKAGEQHTQEVEHLWQLLQTAKADADAANARADKLQEQLAAAPKPSRSTTSKPATNKQQDAQVKQLQERLQKAEAAAEAAESQSNQLQAQLDAYRDELKQVQKVQKRLTRKA